MISHVYHGNTFGVDIFQNSILGSQLKTVYLLDQQPCCILAHKSLIFIGTSHPQSYIYVLDAALFKKIAQISCANVVKSISVIL